MSYRISFYIIIFTISLFGLAKAELVEKADDIVSREGLCYKSFTDHPFTGELKDFSKARVHMYFRNGKKHGPFLQYYPNGQLKEKGKYNEAKKVGQWNYYNQNGRISSLRSYKNGKLDGVSSNFSSDTGILISKIIYQNGKIKDGTYEYFDKDGNLSSVTNFKGGVKFGSEQVINYWDNGRIKSDITYNYDGTYLGKTINGEFSYYRRNGNTLLNGKVLAGKPFGVWTEYGLSKNTKTITSIKYPENLLLIGNRTYNFNFNKSDEAKCFKLENVDFYEKNNFPFTAKICWVSECLYTDWYSGGMYSHLFRGECGSKILPSKSKGTSPLNCTESYHD